MHQRTIEALDYKIIETLKQSSHQWFSIEGLTLAINDEVNGNRDELDEPRKDYCSSENVGLRCGVLLMKNRIESSSVKHYNNSPMFIVKYSQ